MDVTLWGSHVRVFIYSVRNVVDTSLQHHHHIVKPLWENFKTSIRKVTVFKRNREKPRLERGPILGTLG
jgi:hypothetical protein